ncbi:zinc finger CCCH domain-containing protein 38 isoform X2 [Neltuma alba]|uniref:zinc finger CCCH domain-containing protein 38 isoform X2 n=1 Tax=Neltuma alba TaxID=207710 RepID=UPI0010A3D02D|nr:zinc finger CCCH domain-containing protein 38 isoform X2 [Prosopis alba]
MIRHFLLLVVSCFLSNNMFSCFGEPKKKKLERKIGSDSWFLVIYTLMFLIQHTALIRGQRQVSRSGMSGSGRRRSSKWDLRDEPEFVSDSKQLRSGWSSANVTGSNSSKWSYLEGNEKLKPNSRLPFKEPFSGGRVSNKDDIMNKEYNRDLDTKMAWDADESYGMKMSPGLEEWKRKRRSHSPKNGLDRSRSRSRSPGHCFRWESGVNERNRMRAGGLPQPCRDFAVGKCRRGSRCHFLHHDDRNYEDGWDSRSRKDGPPRYSTPYESRDYSARSGRSNETCINFAQGKCRMGASCKYVHHSNSDDMSKGNVDDSTREREFDQRHRESSFERGGGHEPNRFSDTPCKFYAAGNCRNGKYCRFSHDRRASRSPNRRLRDDRWGNNPGGDQTLDRPRGSNPVSPSRRLRDDRWGPDGNMVDMDKVWDGPKLNDAVAVSDAAKLGEDKSGNMGIPEPGFATWPRTDGWNGNLDNNKVYAEPPFVGDKKKEDQWKKENAGVTMGAPQSIGTDKWLVDAEMSPDWNYGSGSSAHIEDKSGQNKLGLTQGGAYSAASEHHRLQVAPGLNQNSQNENALRPSSCNVAGQSQGAVPLVPPLGGIAEVIQNQASSVKKYSGEPNIMDASLSHVNTINTAQNMVSNEQLAQLSSLSASLVQFLGTGQQLPQIYAALNSHDVKNISSLANAEASGEPVSSAYIKPDPVIGSRKLYDPVSDGMEPKDTDAGGITPAFSPSKTIADSSGRQHPGDSCKTSEEQIVKSEHLILSQPGQKVEANKANNEVASEERQDSRADDRNAKDNGPSENLDQNGPDEAKKTKDVKGIRAFKFALVEFVKELLKPTWKEGHINKEHYKTIVKKVVDKVTGTMQGAHIPQTQEKIDHYLSVSKPKLNKLVQAYVEKVQKA